MRGTLRRAKDKTVRSIWISLHAGWRTWVCRMVSAVPTRSSLLFEAIYLLLRATLGGPMRSRGARTSRRRLLRRYGAQGSHEFTVPMIHLTRQAEVRSGNRVGSQASRRGAQVFRG